MSVQAIRRPVRVTDQLRYRWARFRARRRPFAFQQQDCSLTLREGLEEYAEGMPELVREAEVSRAAGEDVRVHDAAHVVFGCDTSVRGEILLTRWSFFGSTDWVPFYFKALRYRGTRTLLLDFFKKARPWTLLAAGLESLLCIGRSLLMRRRWPADDYERFLDRPLVDVRREFRIRVV
ncbi:MAG: hypothetical protein O7A09_14680 [Proteobacteria bacterium]|nr:hypothetical protein [Pseudomonadota bacterium]MCZ6785005.1 hypothetical protein [Pseudomonadota bacterium]